MDGAAMALHYVLDGYNIIKCVDALADHSLEQGRNALIRIINGDRPQGSARNAVTIVFDGRDDVSGPQPGGLARVVFTRGQTADEYIKAAVVCTENRANVIVVSNDKEIICYIRKLGAKGLAVEKFMSGLLFSGRPGGGGVCRRPDHGEKGISRTDEAKINKELEKIWLEE
jgi:predicted RNA-binding protein with PIN domain